MATGDATHDPGSLVGQLLDDTGAAYGLVAFGLPVLAAIAVIGARDGALLNFVHVVAGAIWAGAAVFLTGVLAPTLARFDPDVRGQVNVALIPKNLFLFSGVAIATLITGPVLAVELGIWDLGNLYVLAGVGIGVALLVAAVYVIYLQVAVFREVRSAGPPDQERVGRIAGRLGQIGPVVLVLQVGALVVMALLRTGGF